ncbi:unnamed protein product [Closterium sp. Yama58-4]|nr:unnamed protein product [Closterium sp. Yama58-4]
MAVTGNKRGHAGNIAFASVDSARKKKCVDIHSLLTVTKPLSAQALSHAAKKQTNHTNASGSVPVKLSEIRNGNATGRGIAQTRLAIERGGLVDKTTWTFKPTLETRERASGSNRGSKRVNGEQRVVELAEDDDELYEDVDDVTELHGLDVIREAGSSQDDEEDSDYENEENSDDQNEGGLGDENEGDVEEVVVVEGKVRGVKQQLHGSDRCTGVNCSQPLADAGLDDLKCHVCGREDGEDGMLVCDGRGCNRGYHLWCLRPILVAVPLGQWYCPDCRRPAKIREFPLVQSSIVDFFRIQRPPDLSPETTPAVAGGSATKPDVTPANRPPGKKPVVAKNSEGDSSGQCSGVTTRRTEHSRQASSGVVLVAGDAAAESGRNRNSGSADADCRSVGASRTRVVGAARISIGGNARTDIGAPASSRLSACNGSLCKTKRSSTTGRSATAGGGSDNGGSGNGSIVTDTDGCRLTANSGNGSIASHFSNSGAKKRVPNSGSSGRRKRQTRVKLSSKLFPHRPDPDPERRLEQLRSLATALTAIGARFVDGLEYPFKAVPRGMNEPGREVGGMQVLSRENVGVLERCKEMWRSGAPPPLIVKHDPCQGFVVEADAPIADRTIVTEYGGVVDSMARRRHDPCDAMMGLLFTGRDKTDLVICPDRAANFARFISGINNHTKEGRRKINLRCVRFSVNGEARALLIATRRIAKGERLYYDYNRLVHEYPTMHFE